MANTNYIGIPPTEAPSTYFRQSYLATEGQTVFTNMVYQPGFLDVWHNGSKLMPTEFTATNGTTFTLTNACILNDDVQAIAFGSYTVPGTYTTAQSDARYGVLGSQNVWTKGQSGAIVTLTDASPIALDLSLSNNFSILLTAGIGATRQLGNPSNPSVGQSGLIAITQSSAGTNALTYAGNYKFVAGTAPTLTTTASAVDYLSYYVETATRIFISLAKDIK